MWTRSELKDRAKIAMKPYYMMGVLVCLIPGAIDTGFSALSRTDNIGDYGSQLGGNSEMVAFLFLVGIIAMFAGLLVMVFSIVLGNVLVVGKCRFFIESRYQGTSGGFGLLFSGFSGGHYLNIVKIMFLKGLYEFLWGLLLVIPGIYKTYEYHMIPYLLAENPAIDCKEAFRQSKEMMDGNRFAVWVLGLSFIGWYLLGGLACGIGVLFVNPYCEATLVELYLELNGYHTPKVDTDIYTDSFNTTYASY